jgi:hypothetical protein
MNSHDEVSALLSLGSAANSPTPPAPTSASSSSTRRDAGVAPNQILRDFIDSPIPILRPDLSTNSPSWVEGKSKWNWLKKDEHNFGIQVFIAVCVACEVPCCESNQIRNEFTRSQTWLLVDNEETQFLLDKDSTEHINVDLNKDFDVIGDRLMKKREWFTKELKDLVWETLNYVQDQGEEGKKKKSRLPSASASSKVTKDGNLKPLCYLTDAILCHVLKDWATDRRFSSRIKCVSDKFKAMWDPRIISEKERFVLYGDKDTNKDPLRRARRKTIADKIHSLSLEAERVHREGGGKRRRESRYELARANDLDCRTLSSTSLRHIYEEFYPPAGNDNAITTSSTATGSKKMAGRSSSSMSSSVSSSRKRGYDSYSSDSSEAQAAQTLMGQHARYASLHPSSNGMTSMSELYKSNPSTDLSLTTLADDGDLTLISPSRSLKRMTLSSSSGGGDGLASSPMHVVSAAENSRPDETNAVALTRSQIDAVVAFGDAHSNDFSDVTEGEIMDLRTTADIPFAISNERLFQIAREGSFRGGVNGVDSFEPMSTSSSLAHSGSQEAHQPKRFVNNPNNVSKRSGNLKTRASASLALKAFTAEEIEVDKTKQFLEVFDKEGKDRVL